MHNRGRILNIQRFSTSDGPGIRTVVFLKGCPLNCIWCHNPESKSCETEIFYQQDSCIGCGGCMEACRSGCHRFVQGQHLFEREGCSRCMACVDVCPSNALRACGEEKSAEDVIATVMRDRQFYDNSGGGCTFSGGEPLFQYAFMLDLLKLAKSNHLHTAIETSGFTSKDLTPLHEYTDLWLYDIKLIAEAAHIQYTGVSNQKILENWRWLDRMGAKIILRCPMIPGVNVSNDHFQGLALLANQLSHVVGIHLEAYHPLGVSKAQQLGKRYEYQNHCFLEKSSLEHFAAELEANTHIHVEIV